MSLVQLLRRETAADHDNVDSLYSRFSLDDAPAYRRFLIAHARALPAVEQVLSVDRSLPVWRPRTALLLADLEAIGVPMPTPAAFAVTGEAARWGALYVIEGSRLGGTVLARSVPPGLPSGYLGARHEPGEWRAMLAALDARGNGAGEDWQREAVAGANACFALYATVARGRAPAG